MNVHGNVDNHYKVVGVLFNVDRVKYDCFEERFSRIIFSFQVVKQERAVPRLIDAISRLMLPADPFTAW